MSTTTPETLDEKIARLERAKAEREAKDDEAAKARKAEALELEERFTGELGPRGVKFEIVSNELGNFVVKLGDFVAYKRLETKAQNLTIEDAFQLVTPALVFPDKVTALPILREHAGIVWELANRMHDLYAAKRSALAGK